MAYKKILHLTCMRSTKYGSLERYFVELARICGSSGYQSFFQYEMRPTSEEYIRNLSELKADLIIRKTFQYSPWKKDKVPQKPFFNKSILEYVNNLKYIMDYIDIIKTIRPEILVAHFSRMPQFLILPRISKH